LANFEENYTNDTTGCVDVKGDRNVWVIHATTVAIAT
jgi:hypothetical protein